MRSVIILRIKIYTWAAEVKKTLKKINQHNNVNQKSHFKLFDMATVFNIGQMVHTMKDTGVIIKPKDKGLSGMLKVMCIVVISETIWPMVMVNILISMAQNTKVNLEMMCKKATARKNGLMEPNTSEATKME